MLKKLIDYVKSVYAEMRKVTWPTRNELVSSTVVVIALSIIVAVIIFIMDTVFSSLLGLIVR